MNDIISYAFTGTIMFFAPLLFSIIVFVIKHDIKVTEMMEHYKEENTRLKEENKDMQERINALLNITETNEIDWKEE